jgi:hypothetical protein
LLLCHSMSPSGVAVGVVGHDPCRTCREPVPNAGAYLAERSPASTRLKFMVRKVLPSDDMGRLQCATKVRVLAITYRFTYPDITPIPEGVPVSNVDEAAGSVGANADSARELASGITSSKDLLDQLAAQLAAVGVEAKSKQTRAASDRAEELAGLANGLADALDTLRSQVDALKALLAGGIGGGVRSRVSTRSSSPLRGPAASVEPTRVGKRHLVGQIRLNTPAKERNTVVLPSVDTDADIAAIKSGRARHVRDNLYEVNDRIYGLETPSGTVYPVKGDGFIEMNRLQFTALKGLLAYGGDRAAAEKDPKIARFRRHMTDQTWEHARSVFERAKGEA